MTRNRCRRLRVSISFFFILRVLDISCFPPGQNVESTMLVASLREVIRNQAQEIESLQNKVKEFSTIANEVTRLFSLSLSHFLIA